MNFILGFIVNIITGFLGDWRRDKSLQAKGAADQRVTDLLKENADVAKAVEASADPVLTDLAGVRDDPANRRRKRPVKAGV